MIREDFLHYLWKHKLFDITKLSTTEGESLSILHSGTHNFNAGPDFFNAKIKVDNQVWVGNIEIHVKSSDWYVHNHEKDTAYDTIILHVVWEDDVAVFRNNKSAVTTLNLQKYVSSEMLISYQNLFSKHKKWINCEKDIATISKFSLDNWKERLYLERLENKSTLILELLKKSNNNWEAVLFKLLAKNFGLKVNGASFFNMANSFDFTILKKNQSKILNIEALLFGQLALLTHDIEDSYFLTLKQEYQFLQAKFKLQSIAKNEVSFFRLRPSNFPTIRLSQLANLYVKQPSLFSKIMAITKLEDYYSLLSSQASIYWETHYTFNKTSKKRVKTITKPFMDLLIINTIIPLRFVYQRFIGKMDEETILQIIKGIKPEKNSIIEKFATLQIPSKNALETQALIQLKNDYCMKQRCLECSIGNTLLKR